MDRLSDINTIKKILTKHGFNFSKALGQNFLINPNVCPKMADLCGANENTGVIEIGPGIGVLTCELAKRAKKVVSIELDKRLIPVLNETLSDFNNVKIINDDVMCVNLKDLISEEFAGMDVVLCANLPYYITSPIIMKLLEDHLNLKSITVMIQKEVADRICAGECDRKTGSISLAVNYYSEPEMLFPVSRGSFMPAPNVDSAVIKLNVRENTPYNVINEKLFFKIIRAAFSQRRKTAINSLSNMLGIDKNSLIEIFNELDIPASSRAENISLEQFSKIENVLSKRS